MAGIRTNRYTGSDSGGSGLRMLELDGTPDVQPVTTIYVSNGTLTDNGNGSVTLVTGGGGGGGSLTVTDGVTSVGSTTTLTFLSGATVSSGGAGLANVTITAGGGGTITGSAAAGLVAYGSGPNAITDEAAFAYNDTTDTLSVPTIDFGTSGSRQLTSNTVLLASGASIVASTFDGTVFRSCKYTVQITNVTTSEYQQTELLAIHNGANLYITVYANIYTGVSALGNFSGTYAANTATVSFAPLIPANNYDIKTIEWLTEI